MIESFISGYGCAGTWKNCKDFGSNYFSLNGRCTSFIMNVTSPPINASYYKNYVPFNFSIDRPASFISYALNNNTPVNVTGSKNLTNLAKGWNNIAVFAKDTSGNMGSSNTTSFFYCLADVNGDGVVNMRDIGLEIQYFGKKCGDINYNSIYDLNDDCRIDMRDIGIATANFGTCK